MKKLVYQGFILTNSEGRTDTWKLTISEQNRIGSLFELRRLVNYYLELGIVPATRTSLQDAKQTQNSMSKNTLKPRKRES
ncbi:DUF3319 domain-containing protein [Shewanella oneidensis MR-1]|uniref:DUF3319 domain-containing protein n=1 Tax=Shewanella oneidensis (strain ATCC 700550 / JCM 31522 / CIP 106686 / LMG 19005 / NCIMB 14063 / MR-1) TaxID=211586 RepID=Q8EBQ0_SHEON|nr:DUF3319 domain-containing protein [Shewanella oneidensis]AAN56452.1 protein of unknown function DUF3319 [Shewanella oneidensis MR-1]MDX5999139.1 DUF3319 domain-containing protein [Shewanella oneidensis]MEE2029081.1 hypothetical protein [Shewanella oneidensis]QKG97843.1 DUF3319 domain-containing protein [Shewanella oneidensis MR-1]